MGRPLSVGNTISLSINPGLFTSFTTYTYTPYLDLGDEASPAADTLIRGTPFQEVLTNFPLASQIVSGLFLDINLTGPTGPSQSYDRTLVDRIGYAARQGGSATSIPIDPSSGPAVSDVDIQTINVLPGLQSQAVAQLLLDRLAQEDPVVSTGVAQAVTTSGTTDAVRSSIITAEQSERPVALRSQTEATNLAVGGMLAAYFDRPGVTISGTRMDPSTGGLDFSFDLRRETMRVIPGPGQNPQAVLAFNFTKGLLDNAYEQEVVPSTPDTTNLGTLEIIQQALAQNIPFATFTTDNLSALSALDLSADVKARIAMAVSLGEIVVVPINNVTIGGTQAITWLEINPRTGDVSGVLEDGTRSEIAEEMRDRKRRDDTGGGSTGQTRGRGQKLGGKSAAAPTTAPDLPRNPFAKQALAIKLFDLRASRARARGRFFQIRRSPWLRPAGRFDCPG